MINGPTAVWCVSRLSSGRRGQLESRRCANYSSRHYYHQHRRHQQHHHHCQLLLDQLLPIGYFLPVGAGFLERSLGLAHVFAHINS